MPLVETVTIGEKEVTAKELTVREIYGASISPPSDPSLIPLYLALDMDYPLVLESVSMTAEELIALHPSDLDRVTEAFRKANPFLEKPMVKQSREKQREVLVSSFSGLFAASLQRVTAPEPGITP